MAAALPVAAWANCTSSGTTVSCDGSAPNPYTSTIGTGPSTASGTTVTLGPNAQVVVGDANAISLGNNATITVGGGGLVQNTASGCCGLFGVGNNTIEFNNNGTLTIAPGGKVYAAGTSGIAEAINTLGRGTVIDNFGTIQADRAFAIFFESFSGTGTIINEMGGVLQGPNIATSVLGGNGSVNFTNEGQVIGSLTLTGRNDQLHLYTGSSVTGSTSGAGGTDTLTLNGTGSGTLASAISNFETLTKQDPGTWTLTGSISNGAVAIQDGTLVLTGANTYSGGTTLGAGMLTAGNNSALGTGPLSMAAGTTLSFLNTGNFVLANHISIAGDPNFAPPSGTVQTLTGVISDASTPGTLNMQGPGTLVLTGNSSYSGGTTIAAGTLQLGNGGTSGSIVGDVANNGTLAFNRSDTLSFAGAISGTGSLAQIGPGTTVLTGANTYTGGTMVSGGELQLLGGSTLGAPSGMTTVSGGVLDLGGTTQTQNGGLSLIGGTVQNGTLSSSGSFALQSGTVSAALAGPGAVSKISPDTVVLSGQNTYTGATTISYGTLALGSGGSIAASSGVNLIGAGTTFDISGGRNETINDLSGGSGTTVAVGGNTLTFGTSNSTTFGGSFAGSGGLTWQGTGTFALTGNSSGFTGSTTINSGTFGLGSDSSPNAKLGGNVTVAGGVLTGFGAIGGDLITNGGVVRPGGSIGTLTVNGNYSQASSGTLSLEVSPIANSQLKVGGAASLGGRLALLYDPGIYTPRTYTLVQAGSVSGAFGLATGTLPTRGLNQEVLISPTSVLLTLTSAPLPPVPSTPGRPGAPATPVAQPGTPGAPPPPSVPGPPGLPAIPGVEEPGTPGAPADAIEIINVPAGDTIAVEPTNDTIYSAVTTTAILTAQQANGIILDRLGNRQAGIADGQVAALGGAVPTVQYAQAGNAAVLGGLASALPQSLAAEGAWFRGVGGFASLNGNSTAPGFTGETGGFLAGYDRPVMSNVYLGVAGGYLHSNIDEHSTSSGTQSSARFALYGGAVLGPSLLTATAGYAHDWFDTQRGIADIGTAVQSHGGNEATFAGQWSLPWQIQGFGGGSATLTPKAGFQFVHLTEGSFSETGASGFDLSSRSHNTDSFQPYVGVAAAEKFVTSGGTEITPELRLGYAYEALSNSRLLTVTAVDGANFPISGVKPSRNQLTGGLGITMWAAPNLSFFASYDAVLPTGNITDHAVQAGLRWRF